MSKMRPSLRLMLLVVVACSSKLWPDQMALTVARMSRMELWESSVGWTLT